MICFSFDSEDDDDIDSPYLGHRHVVGSRAHSVSSYASSRAAENGHYKLFCLATNCQSA
jgi:hypothetical protein